MNTVFLKQVPDWPAIWCAARERLRRELGGATFDAWLAKLDLLDFQKDELKFGAPKPWVRNWVANNFVGRIEKSLRLEGGNPTSVTIILGQSERRMLGAGPAIADGDGQPGASIAVLPAPERTEASGANELQPVFCRSPNPEQSFSTFVAGTANALALQAARDFAQGDADGVALLFIHGNFGFGKSHLLNATALESQRLGARTLLLRSEDFMRLFLGALKSRDTLSFKEHVRAADLLLIDDVHHLCRSTSTVSELLHTLNAYTDLRRRLVIAADRPAAGLENIGADLRSRLTGGLTISIEKPDRAMRLAILKARAEEHARKRGAIIPDEALERIADVEHATPRDLIGFFNNLKMHAQLTASPLAFRTAVEMIAARGTIAPRVSIEDVQKKIADYYEIDPREFRSSQRSRRVTRPRQVAMFLARAVTMRSLPEIGRRFGGRDHTTVLHACRRIASLCDEDPTFKQEIDFLKRFLGMEN